MKLLVTRPLPGADATVARVEAAGHEAIRLPLFGLAPVQWQVPDPAMFDAMLLSSGNAVRLARVGLQAISDLPVYAVGNATAQTAGLASLDIVAIGTSGVHALLPVAQAAGHCRLLWLAGRDRIELQPPKGMTITPVTVYTSDALPAPADFADTVGQSDAVLLHSPRAAARFCALCEDAGLSRASISIAAFSPAIAEAAGDGWKKTWVSAEPSDKALLSLLANGPTNSCT